MIRFEDFFKISEPSKTKVKFNIIDGDKTYAYIRLMENEDDLKKDAWIKMNAHRSEKSVSNNLDKAEYILSFAQYYPYGTNYYVFGGLYKITNKNIKVKNGTGYDLVLLDDYKEYRKRLMIKLENTVGQTYNRWFETIQNKLNPEIYTLFPSTQLTSFPGYDKVCLKHKELQIIFNNNAPEWKDSLSCIKGVYCITDTSTGKLYIGSASGIGGIWERWSSYANVKDLTGGNKTFEELKNKGANYIVDNFTYSILEVFDIKTNKGDIIRREEYWKRVFKTVEHGMNN